MVKLGGFVKPLVKRTRLGDLYFGWPMLLGLSAAEVTSWGILYYSFSVFLDPMRDALGWSTTELTGAYSLALLLSGLTAIPVGRWLDRHGPRLLMSLGSIAAALLVVAWSSVHNLVAFYAIWVGIGVVMATVFYEPAFYVVAQWFDRLRSRALTLLTFVGGFASVIYLPLAGWLLRSYGWREALLILAAILLVGTLPVHALLLRRHPRDLGLEPDGKVLPAGGQPHALAPSASVPQALHDPGFWWLTGSFCLVMFTAVAVTVHLIPYLIGQGYSSGFAATAAGLVGLFALPGRLIFTPLGGRIPRRYVTALIFLLQAFSIAVLLAWHSTLGVFAFVALFGSGFGAITPARAALVVELYGPGNYGSIAGMLALWVTVARAAGPFVAGVIFGLAGSYQPVFWTLLAASALAALAALQIRSNVLPDSEARTHAPASNTQATAE